MKVDKLSPETIEIAKAAWIEMATKLDMPTADYAMQMDWAAKHLNYEAPNGDSLAYGVVDEAGEIVALIDIVYSKRPGPDLGWLKMLDVKLSPKYSPAELDISTEKILIVADIYTAAFIGTIELTGHHIARVVKLYGRDAPLLAVLKAIKVQLNLIASDKFETTIAGRWLVISPL